MKKISLTSDHFLWAAMAALYLPAFIQLYGQRWENIDYTHAYFILPVSLILIWLRRRDIAQALNAEPSSGGALLAGQALLALGLFLFAFGWRMGYAMVYTFSLIPVVFGVILVRYNRQVARLVLFPVLYLLLLVPPPLGILDAVTLPLRSAVTTAVQLSLGLLYPVQREGLFLTIGHAQVYIGAPCSGLRSLVSIFALALVYVHLVRMPGSRKLILISALLPLALLGNFLRVISLCLVTYYFGKDVADGPYHMASGVLVFFVLIAGMMWLGRVLIETREQSCAVKPDHLQ